MSAFYDLWIGTQEPQKARLNNTAWQKNIDGKYYLSLPQNDIIFLCEKQSSTHTLVILGQFYEPVDHQKLLKNCVDYVAGATSIFDDPAGHYILFLFDKLNLYTHIFTNRLGTYHAYYRTGKNSNAISTYYLGLAKHAENKQLDWEGITGFFAMGFFPVDKTYLNSIKIFQSASYYCFDENLNLIKQQRYWQWTRNVSGNDINIHTVELDNILKLSLSYSLQNKRIALPISGGLDSRVLAGVTTQNQYNNPASIWGFSYGYSSDSVETKIAAKIAKKRNIPFNQYVVPNYLFDKLDIITDSVELFQYVDGTRQACMQELLEKRSDVVVCGHWGDVWMDTMGVEEPFGNDWKDALLKTFRKKIFKNGNDWLLKEVCKPYLTNSKEYLDSYFSDFVSQYQHINDIDFIMKIFKTDQWSFRWTLSSIRMHQAGSFPVLPFYDKRIVDLFIKVPNEQVKDRLLEIEYLKVYHHDLARITWQEYDRNLYNYKWFNNRSIVYRGVKKIQRGLSPSKTIIRNWEIFYLNENGRKNLEQELLTSAVNEIIPASKINMLLDDFYRSPSSSNGYAVSMLLTLSQFINKIL